MKFHASVRLLVTAAVVLSVIAGCGGDDGGGESENTNAQSSSEGQETSDGSGQTLTVWSYYVGGGQVEALEAQNDIFAQEHPDVTVEHVQLPFDQLAPRLLAGVTTEDGPDVVFDNVVVDFPALAASGALLDISEYWSGFDEASQFPDSAVWEQEGGIYNVMSYTNLLATFVNDDVLTASGVEVPTTIGELETAMAAVADAGEATPLAMSGVASPEGAWMFMPILLGQGIDYCNLDGPEVEDALTRLENWAEQGWIPRETATWDQADAWQAFISGDYAFGFNGNWNLGDLDGLDFEVSTTRYPAGEEGSQVFPGGEGIGIGSFSEDPDLAWEYIRTAWMSPEGSIVNFQNSGQIPTRGDLADSPEIQESDLVQPFVTAAGETASWPSNENSAAMQNAVGRAVSDVISGSASGAEAAKEVIEAVADELEGGGGSC